MEVEQFFNLFLQELRQDQRLWTYYKFFADEKKFAFRKAYFCQRLNYIATHVGEKDQLIWDCGCGYGTTALFLAVNGYNVFGTTLEFYYNVIESRKAYWSQYGDVSKFGCTYENLMDSRRFECFDTVIVQDTLHHLEPIDEALKILRQAVKPSGQMIVVEENGANIIQTLKLFKQRGFKRVITIYDEQLQKEILFGNENIRSFGRWKMLFRKAGFVVDEGSLQYIRILPPSLLRGNSSEQIIQKEQRFVNKMGFARELFYFGINFIAYKESSE